MKQSLIILLLVACSLMVRIPVFINTDNADGISMGRVVDAIDILENPAAESNFDPNTSVLYSYFLALVLHFWPDPLNAPRVFTMFFGVLTVIPFYFLVRLLFNERTALFSALLLSADPFHAIQSVLSTSDAAFYFLFLSSLYYLFKFREHKGIFAFILSLVLFNIASLLRFESWVFIPLLPLFLYRSGKKYVLLYFLCSLVLPGLWLYLCRHFTGDMFYSFNSPAVTMRAEITLLKRIYYTRDIFAWLVVLFKTVTPALTLIGISGMLYALYKRRKLALAALFVFLYCLYTFNTVSARMWLNYRYSILLGMLLMPYAILAIESFAEQERINSSVLLILFTLFCMFEFKDITRIHLRNYRLSYGIKELAEQIHSRVKPQEKVAIVPDELDVSDQDIIVRSGLRPGVFTVISTMDCVKRLNTQEEIDRFILRLKPDYLVWASNSCLQKKVKFDLRQDKLREDGWRLELVHMQPVLDRSSGVQKYNIYKVSYD